MPGRADLLDIFARQGGRPCLIDPGRGLELSYAQLAGLAMQLARVLDAQGHRPGQRLALLLPNCPEMAALYLACLLTGRVASPVNPALHPREIAFILAHCGASLLVAAPSTLALLEPELAANPPWGILCLIPRGEQTPAPAGPPAWRWSEDLDLEAALPPAPPEGLASIHFTSGTTGRPKGVVHTSQSLVMAAQGFNRHLGFDQRTRMYHVLPMAYMAGFLNTLLCPWLAGGAVVLGRQFDALSALRFWEAPQAQGVNTLWLVPAMLAALLAADRGELGPRFCREQVAALCVGTAPLPPSLARQFEERYGARALESYGLSETLFCASNAPGFPGLPGSVGRLLTGVELDFRDEQGESLPPGQEGQIYLRSPFNMAGYLDYQTQEPVAPPQWFPSGDLGRLDGQGHLFITGRLKDLIIRAGTNLSPRAVEETILEHPAVAQAAVVGLPHALYGEEVAAALVLRPGHDMDSERPGLIALCRQRLSPAALPTRWLALSDLPKNQTGKVMKDQVKAAFAASARPGE